MSTKKTPVRAKDPSQLSAKVAPAGGPQTTHNTLWNAGAAAGILAAVVAVLVSAAAVWRFHSPVPIDDIWWMWRDLRNLGFPPPISWYWTALIDMPHRIALPKIFYVLDWWIAGGTTYFASASAIAAQALHVFLAARWIRRHSTLAAPGISFATVSASILVFALFAPQQWENFLHGFQVCFTLWLLLAFVSLKAAVEDRLETAHVAAMGSMLCVVGAVFLWPVIAAIAWIRKQSRKSLAVCVALPVVFTIVYRIGIISETPKATFGAILEFFLRFFAQPFFAPASSSTIFVGPLILCAGLFVIWSMLSSPADSSDRQLRLLIAATLSFLILVIAVISYGRAALGFAHRYHTAALLFWAWTAIGLVYWNAKRCLPVVLAFMALAMLQFQPVWDVIDRSYRALNVEGTEFAAYDKVADPNRWQPMYWLKQNRKSMFGESPYSLIGSTLQITPGVADCADLSVRTTTRSKHGWKIEASGAGNRDGDFIYIVRLSDNLILGVAARTSRATVTEWTGYLPPSEANTNIRFGASSTAGTCVSPSSFAIQPQ